MPGIGYWAMLLHRAMLHLAARPHVLPAHVIETVEAMGCGPFIMALVPHGDPVQVDYIRVMLLLCLHLCDLALGWVPYAPAAAAAA
jgi:hypothetical protein